MLLDDFAYTIILNSKCSPEKVPEGLKELYAYINNPKNVGKSELVKNIDARVKKFNSEKWRTKGMTFNYYLKEEKQKGIIEGRTEGLVEGKLEMAKAMKMKNYPIEDIAELTGLPIKDISVL